MFFHTPEFLVLLLLNMVVFYMFPRSRLYVLALGNAVFYGATGVGYLALFIAVAAITFVCTLGIRGRHGILLLTATIVLNVANLVCFKYAMFMLTNVERLAGIELVEMETFFSKMILPVGISFYTFQLIAYAVDVYKGKLEATRSPIQFWVFISFFGQLVAGPIMRGKDFLPQIERLTNIRFSGSNMRIGAAYFCLGLVKKIVFADDIAEEVNVLFERSEQLNGMEGWAAAYLFAFQIYFDFSAYSEMAVGIGYFFGMKLDINFRTPYISGSGTEFWRRWHITLSSFIKDYIYIPLGGSRQGRFRQYTNLFIAMTVSGLWHGAAWTFLAWGMFHGLLLVAHKIYSGALGANRLDALREHMLYRALTIIAFFHITCIGWVFFRADGIGNALGMVGRMLQIHPSQWNGSVALLFTVAAGLYILHIAEYLFRKHAGRIGSLWHGLVPSPLRGLAYAGLIWLIILFLRGEESSFIYFQF
ncbi:MBOAT family O-acyltransferase [Paenibacillus sp.]|uniref:MBOAT family O-acyltransferase n=1 Tax=Paenibacillus sp. TaxID=58172 RepID=UPI0028116F16|nr:MBOAT family O-acyltransferase [Paenibacillus sp.]